MSWETDGFTARNSPQTTIGCSAKWLLGDFEPNAESMDKTLLEKQAGATLCMERFDDVLVAVDFL
jgi:hypothetical protein